MTSLPAETVAGMATVYLAEDLKHKRRVAVKLLRPQRRVVGRVHHGVGRSD